ncbi:MAG: hypothetical protein J6M53_08355 [Bacteroidaceae bacterium]|nr:hypothetical protein [Bacteroidaceae bacterium]
MKTLRILAALVLLAATAAPSFAQDAIQDAAGRLRPKVQAAFDRLVSDPKVLTAYSISYGRPATQGTASKASMLETWKFQMKAKKSHLVADILDAMAAERDNPACYRVETYLAETQQQPRAWNIIYGEDASQYVEIGRNRSKNYAFVNIADQSAEPTDRYRTCYCIEWYKVGREIVGRLIVAYARIPDVAATAANPLGAPGGLDTNFEIVTDIATLDFPFDFPFDATTSPLLAQGLLAGGTLNLSTPLTRFNALRQSFVSSDEPEQMCLIATLIYQEVKRSVSRGELDADERKLVSGQLAALANSIFDRAATSPDISAARDYLLLAKKVADTGQTP